MQFCGLPHLLHVLPTSSPVIWSAWCWLAVQIWSFLLSSFLRHLFASLRFKDISCSPCSQRPSFREVEAPYKIMLLCSLTLWFLKRQSGIFWIYARIIFALIAARRTNSPYYRQRLLCAGALVLGGGGGWAAAGRWNWFPGLNNFFKLLRQEWNQNMIAF
jgi:hypothetical protein